MTLKRACEIYIDVMHGVENTVTDVTDAMHIIEEHTGRCSIFYAMKWCEDYLTTHEDSPMRTENEIREKIKALQKELEVAPRLSDHYFAINHDINLLRWVLKEE